MTPNLKPHHRLLHAVAGAIALGAVLLYPGTSGWLGVIGVVLIGSAVIAWCPARAALGRLFGCGCGCVGGKGEPGPCQHQHESPDASPSAADAPAKGPCCGPSCCGGEKTRPSQV